MRTAMQQHIRDGCGKCMTALQVWKNVLSIARAETALTPLSDAVRVSKSRFTPTPAKAKHGLRLLFDSHVQPVTAGVRGAVSARQFLYETDDYYIDLRLEPRRDSDSACLVGQVLNRTGGERAAQKVPESTPGKPLFPGSSGLLVPAIPAVFSPEELVTPWEKELRKFARGLRMKRRFVPN